MAETGGIKILAIFTICIILFSILISGCVEDDDKDKNNNENNNENEVKIYYEYLITIDNVNTSFNVILPVPIYKHNQSIITSIISKLRMNNSIIVKEIENFEYGMGINLSSDSNFYLESIGELLWFERYARDAPPMHLNLIADYDRPNWVLVSEKYYCYSSVDNITLAYNFYITYGGSYFEWYTETITLEKGWQIIDLKGRIAIS